ncbi:MAG: hypothetical protein K2L07_10425 [Lachnospiraceae bacterium]|nr:hypothetical protein [Lachnospiraceae bacterium]
MIKWTFRETIIYQKEKVSSDSRKFEILIETYLKERYPLENWKLTKATRDGNRDLENICEFTGMSMWAEAKYTIHTEENIGSRKYDSTLVSSMFEENLIKIFFITNTSIGSNLIGRIRKFFYLSEIKEIAFVDGYTLSYWIKKHPDIEQRFFEKPIAFTAPSMPNVKLHCVRVVCKADSYTIDCVLENQVSYPLYLSHNYLIEGEFLAVGFEDDIPLSLYCNNQLVYQGTVLPEISTFALNLNDTKKTFSVNEEYPLELYYILDNKKYICGEYSLKFAVLGELYKNQVQNYTIIENGLKANYKEIYNIYGPQNSGKSWLINNLKNDLLKKAQEEQRIIYVNFNGQDSDVADLCRIIFTLVFNYYNLGISAKAFSLYCKEHNLKNSLLSPSNIETVIKALRDDDYLLVQNILLGSIFSNTESLFETKQCFDYTRIYFLDNVHLLSANNDCILKAILNAFKPMQKVSFVLTSRNKISGSYIKNISLDYIENDEVLQTICENTSFTIKNIDEILPQKHYLKYPGLLHAFLQDVRLYSTIKTVKDYYIGSFQDCALRYVKGSFSFNNITLLLICFVEEGIPIDALDASEIGNLYNKKFIVTKYGYVYPNLEKWNRDIPQSILEGNKQELLYHIFKLIEEYPERKEIYQCALMRYYPEYYNQYFDSVFQYIKLKFEENRYSQIVFLCEALLKKKFFYSGNAENINYIKYFLAFSYMHCDASKDAQSIFREIVKDYSMKAKTSLYFDAESENIDAAYWSFRKFRELPEIINQFRRNWMDFSQEKPDISKRSYLTATNRMMVTYLALDQISLAKKWFQKNIKLAVKFNAPEHVGYTYMDYAKGIYHKNLSLALQYLQIADHYFQTPSEKRRHLDCLCEIQYVKLLIGEGSIQKLLSAQGELFENQYWIQYYKCHLKLAVCYILKGKYSNAKSCLMEVEANTFMRNDERVKYLCSIINAVLYKEPICYENTALWGTSYQKMIDHVCLDPRMW